MSEKQRKRQPLGFKQRVKRTLLRVDDTIDFLRKVANEIENSLDTDKRIDYSDLEMLNKATGIINFIKYNKDKKLYFIASEALFMRKLVNSINSVDGILEAYNKRIQNISSAGEYDKIVEDTQNAAKFIENLNKFIEEINSVVKEQAKKGMSNQNKNKIKRKEVTEDVKKGMKLSELKEKYKDDLGEEIITNIFMSNVKDYVNANKEDIKRLLLEGKDYEDVSKEYEFTKPDKLFTLMKEWSEEDGDIKKVVADIMKKRKEERDKLVSAAKEKILAGAPKEELEKEFQKRILNAARKQIEKETKPEEG